MLSSFSKVLSFHLKVSRLFRATPFDFNPESCKLELLFEYFEYRRYINACHFVFCYVGIAVIFQWMMIPTATESYILSLTFTLLVFGAGILKLMVFRDSRGIAQLLNSITQHECEEFGKNFRICYYHKYLLRFHWRW
jgi:hypothetical protein